MFWARSSRVTKDAWQGTILTLWADISRFHLPAPVCHVVLGLPTAALIFDKAGPGSCLHWITPPLVKEEQASPTNCGKSGSSHREIWAQETVLLLVLGCFFKHCCPVPLRRTDIPFSSKVSIAHLGLIYLASTRVLHFLQSSGRLPALCDVCGPI